MSGGRGGKRKGAGRKPDPHSMRAQDERDSGKTPAIAPEGAARCPSFLDAEARAEWNRLAPELERLGLLTSIDQSAFAAYCQAWGDLAYVCNALRVRKKRVGPQPPSGKLTLHPLMQYRAQAMDRVVRYAGDFGMTPSARAAVRDLTALPGTGGGQPASTGGTSDDSSGDGSNVTVATDRFGHAI